VFQVAVIVIAVMIAIGWYREHQRAEASSIAREQLRSQLDALNHDGTNADSTLKPAGNPGSSNSVAQGTTASYTATELELYRCSSQIFEINVAAQRWAAEHDGVAPQDLTQLRDYLAPMTLVCPGVRPKSLARTWDEFNLADISYWITPSPQGVKWDFKNLNQPSKDARMWLTCPYHNIFSMNSAEAGRIPPDRAIKPGSR
jgi:hypothetical protein